MNKVFKLALFCATLATCNVASATTAMQEKENWQYIQNELTAKMTGFTTVSNKIGAVLQDYAAYITAPISASLGSLVWLSIDDYLEQIPGLAGNNWRILVRIAIPGSIITSLNYLICKSIGTWLAGKDLVCQKALGDYVLQWSQHKNNTPEALLPLFESLQAQGSQLNPQDAQKLVEGILSIAIAVTVLG